MFNSFRSRLHLISIFFYIMAGLIILQTTRLQTQAYFKPSDPEVQNEMVLVEPERGLIYDRYGHLLAGNQTVYEVGLNLNLIDKAGNAKTIASVLSQILEKEYSEVLGKASTKPGSEGGVYYKIVEDFATREQVNKIYASIEEYQKQADNSKEKDESDTLVGIDWRPQTIRVYPEGTLASNVIGYQTPWGDAHYGIEQHYDNLLSGVPVYVNVADSAHIFEADYSIPSGANLVLTIDRNIQSSMENILDKYLEETKADTGTIIVMDPETGEVLSMATGPRVDPKNYTKFEGDFNPAIDHSYEPGSVFKILTMASALDSNTVESEDTFLDTGSYTIGTQTYQNWDRSAWGPQTMTTCMEHSLNVCLAYVADQLGPTNFYNYLKAFWIGRSTNIDLAGESVWPLYTPSDSQWKIELLGSNSFGQSVMVTPIQMVMAGSALANEGKMVAPHVVKSYMYDGMTQEINTTVVNSPISKESAKEITDMLAISMEGETYQKATIPGYRIAGKTGTATIPENGVLLEDVTNTSFIGWGPADDPKFLVYIWLEKPKTDIWASLVVSPIFKEIVEELVVLMDIPPDEIRQELLAKE